MSFALAFLGRNWRLVLLGAVLAALTVQSARLSHAKGDLREARAALIDPVTKAKWPDIARKAQADLGTCQQNAATLNTALDREKAALTALSEEGSRRLAETEKALQRQRSATAAASKRAGELLNRPPAGNDECQRYISADEAVLRALR